MLNNNSKDEITREINDLVENIEKVKENVDIYCELMKKMFLSTSGLN